MAAGLLACALALPASGGGAQRRPALAVAAPARLPDAAGTPLADPGMPLAVQAPAASAVPILASALVPGLGQAMQGVDRAIPYLVAEAFSWTSYAWYSTDARRQRDGYRDLSARVARAMFTPVRPHGDFAYYERMSHYPEAGRFDVVAGGILDPEPDSTTWNGAVWLLARRTYWSNPGVPPDTGSPEWKRAIAFYQGRAYDQLYRWSWGHAPDEYAAFRGLIDASNEATRRSLQALGIVIANHVLSTVDAWIVVRLRNSPDALGTRLAVLAQFPVVARRRGLGVAQSSSGRR